MAVLPRRAVARFPGEAIAGEKITYGFGRVNIARAGDRYAVSLGDNGSAFVAKRWFRRTPEDTPPIPDPSVFDSLDARSADGLCDRAKEDGKKHKGAHRERTGTLSGSASVTVVAPRANVEHLQ